MPAGHNKIKDRNLRAKSMKDGNEVETNLFSYEELLLCLRHQNCQTERFLISTEGNVRTMLSKDLCY